MYRLAALALLALIGYAKTSLPEPFGVTMVEETNCIGQGGQILEGPDGAFCAEG
ncbi:MAG: hypothetical protein QNL76_13220 [Octadecabacter sp.]